MAKVIFVTTKKSKGQVILKQGFTITDEVKIGNTKKTTKKRRKIQYCEDFDSIFVDEQVKLMGEVPTRTKIKLFKGKLTVDEENTSLIKFLRISPQNVANGGNVFKELDVEKEDLYEVEKFKKTSKICNAIMDGEEKLVRSIAVWLLGTRQLKVSINKIKKTMYTRCQQDYDFVEKVEKLLEDKSNKTKLLVTVALKEDIIQIDNSGKKIIWTGGESIYVGAQSKDIIKDFAKWMETDEEGRQTLKLLAEKLD